MQLRHLFACLLLTATAPLRAQYIAPDSIFQPYGLIVRLSDEEAVQLVHSNTPDTLLKNIVNAHTAGVGHWRDVRGIVDTFHHSKSHKKLPSGHYLEVVVADHTVEAKWFSVSSLQVFMHETGVDFALVITDSVGRRLREGEVWLAKKKIPFDEISQTWRLKNRKKGGLLTIRVGGETVFYRVEAEPFHKKWNPYRHRAFNGRLASNDYVRHFAWRQAAWRKQLTGYIAFNQPRYQPGDTVRIKAYVADHKFRPKTKPLWGVIKRGADVVAQIKITPRLPGHYEWNFPLSDTLRLDQSYQVVLSDPKKPRLMKRFGLPYQLNAHFYYEDYQLDEMRCQFSLPDDEIGPADRLRLKASATDANGNPAPDAEIKLTVIAQSVGNWYAPMVETPDTLWQYRQGLQTDGDQWIEVPDSIFPRADIEGKIFAQISNAAGELQQFSETFSWHKHQPLTPDIDVKNGRLQVRWNVPDNLPDTVQINLTRCGGGVEVVKARLPYSAAISPDMVSIGVKYHNFDEAYQVTYFETPINQEAFRHGDTVAFYLINPLNIPVQYRIEADKTIVEEGACSDSLWKKELVDTEGKTFRMTYTFVWGGESRRDEAVVDFYNNLLKIAFQQPHRVEPGAVAQVQVEITDAKGRPAQGVQLVAGAYHAQFEGGVPVSGPNIRHKQHKQRRDIAIFKLEAPPMIRSALPLNRPLHDLFGLDSLLAYRIVFRPAQHQGVWAERLRLPPLSANNAAMHHILTIQEPNADQINRLMQLSDAYTLGGYQAMLGQLGDSATTKLQKPQIAAYIAQNNRPVPVYLVWLNSQLAYYHGVAAQQPYSFIGEKGGNNLVIRTRDGEYEIKNLWLESGEKLELALDADHWKSPVPVKTTLNGHPAEIRYTPKPDTLTPFEQQTLRQTILTIRQSGNHPEWEQIWQGGRRVHLIQPLSNGLLRLGPFAPDSYIAYLHGMRWYSTFKFEPGYEYELAPSRDRLYATTWPANGHARLPQNIHPPLPGMRAWTLGDLKTVSVATAPAFNLPRLSPGGHARIAFQWNQPADTLSLIEIEKDGKTISVVTPINKSLIRLQPGRYDFFFHRIDGAVCRRQFTLKTHTLLAVTLSDCAFETPDTARDWRKRWVKYPVERKQITALSSNFSSFLAPDELTVLTGQVIDADNHDEPLIGATIKILQQNISVKGVITDYDGRFRVALSPGVYDLEVQYTGYTTHRYTGVIVLYRQINNVGQMAVESSNELYEVSITAYKVPLISQDMVSTGNLLTSDEIKNLPTRSINTISSTTAGAFDGGEIQIKGSRNFSENLFLDGISIDGNVFNNPLGVDINEMIGDPVIRTQFRDYAWWQPTMITDDRGRAAFQVKYPDNIASWRTFAAGMDRKGRGGVGLDEVGAFKSLTAQVSLPRFVVVGDQFNAVGRALNVSGDSLRITTQFGVDHFFLPAQGVTIGEGWTEYARVETPDADSLRVTYQIRGEQSADGEARSIAILPAGDLETEGFFALLTRDTAFEWTFDETKGPVTLRAQGSVADLLLDDIENLVQYPYGCNEQVSSRLIALLAFENILPRLPDSHPARMRVLPGGEQTLPQLTPLLIAKAIRQLERAQNADGSWGWWSQNEPNPWMTLYVCRTLISARESGRLVPALDRGLTWIRLQLSTFQPADQTEALLVLRLAGVNMDCHPYLSNAEKQSNYTTHDRLRLLQLRQLCGQNIMRDSFDVLLQRSTWGGISALGGKPTDWYDRSAVNTLLAYDIARQSGWSDYVKGIQLHWLSSRKADKRDLNTVEKAQIIRRLAATDSTLFQSEGAAIKVNGDRFFDAKNGDQTGAFAETTYPAGTRIRIEKSGRDMAFFTAYQQWQNTAPAPRNDLFALKTTLWQDGKAVSPDSLEQGATADLFVELEVKETGEYLMLEAPVPAACSYGPKLRQEYGFESHREYYRDRVCIFFESLPVGQYRFRIPLEVRFSGRFTLNPARVEQMYFPTFFGRNELKKCTVR